MEKWKKKIIGQIYKVWISRRHHISAVDITIWLNDPKTATEIHSEMLKHLERSWYFRIWCKFKEFIWSITGKEIEEI